MFMIPRKQRPSIAEIIGENASALRLARGPRARVPMQAAQRLAANARVAADAGKPATAAALGVLAAGAVSPASMELARRLAASAALHAPGQAMAMNVIRRIKAQRDAGDLRAQRALDTIALAAKVNAEDETAAPWQERAAAAAAAREAATSYDPKRDPMLIEDIEALQRERGALRSLLQAEGLAGPIAKFSQGQEQIRARGKPEAFSRGRRQITGRKPPRFLGYRGRTAIVGQWFIP